MRKLTVFENCAPVQTAAALAQPSQAGSIAVAVTVRHESDAGSRIGGTPELSDSGLTWPFSRKKTANSAGLLGAQG